MSENNDAALVLFSGGQDSTTCLAWALERWGRVETIGFSYGQRHLVEMEQRSVIRNRFQSFEPWSDRLGEDHLVDLASLGAISATSLTSDMAFALSESGMPNTFVPGRNIIFMTYAAAIAYRRGIKHIVTGVCETDFSGYPDCRDDTMKALQVALNLGMERRFVIHTPLMWIDKAATWKLARDIAGDWLVDLIRTDTHTCYLGDRSEKHDWGFGCSRCPACDLRRTGYDRFRADEIVN